MCQTKSILNPVPFSCHGAEDHFWGFAKQNLLQHVPSSVLVTSSKALVTTSVALVTSSDALVPNSFLFLVRPGASSVLAPSSHVLA